MGYRLPGHREDEFGAARGPLAWSEWPKNPVIGDRVEMQASLVSASRIRVGDEVTGPNGEIAVVIKTHPGGAMFKGSVTFEVVGLPFMSEFEIHPRSRISSVGQ